MSRRKLSVETGYEGSEPWVLPADWRWMRLGDICEPSQYGWTTSAARVGNLKFVRTTDISSGRLNWLDVPFCQDEPPEPSRYLLADGDILVSRAGSVGKSFLVRDAERAVFASYLIRFRPKINGAFLHYWLQTDYYWQAITDGTAGIAIPNVNASKLSEIPVPIPPPETQQEIVKSLQVLFAEVDDGEAALAQARADLEVYRRSLLKAAVTGELTADWRAANPPKETGADLLARILADRRARWQTDPKNNGKKYREPAEPQLGRLTTSLPSGWVWAGLEQFTTVEPRNGLSVKECADLKSIKGLRLDALQSEGVDWTRTRYLPITEERARPYLLQEGDLLVSRANGSREFLGRCSPVTAPPPNVIFPDTAIRYRIAPELLTWAQMVWSSPICRQQLLSSSKSTAGILKVSQVDIGSVALPMPPRAEIAEAVCTFSGLSKAAERCFESGVKTTDIAALKQTVLAAAFRGELA